MPGQGQSGDCRGRHQVAFGDRHIVTITMAAEAGRHHLKAFAPIIRHFVSESTPIFPIPICVVPQTSRGKACRS